MEPRPTSSAAHVRLRDYELLELLGQGGMGAVYKALHTRLDKIVALKVLPMSRLRDPHAVARFEREMKAVGKLDHPHIVRATDAGEVNGLRYLVMEFVDGMDVSRVARYAGPLHIADACELVRQATLGLQHVHEAGLVHRDLKPSNLILTPGGIVKILDLGLALLRESSTTEELTDSGIVVGTLDYMAPEQCVGSHVDIRADIYSLGATAFKLLTGQAPLGESSSPYEKLQALVEQPAPPLCEMRADVPAELAAVVGRALVKDPGERFASPAELAVALEPFTQGHDLPELLRLCRDRQKAAGEETPREVPTPQNLGLYIDSETLTYAAALPRHYRRLKWLGLLLLATVLVGAGFVAAFWNPLREIVFPSPTGSRPALPRPTDTPGEVYVYECLTTGVSKLALSADGRLLLSKSEDKTMILWDVRTGKELHTLAGHNTAIRTVAISADGTRGLSGGYAEKIRYWDLETGRLLREFDGHGEWGNQQWVGGVAFAPNGKRFASAGTDRMVRIWDLEGDKPPREWQVHQSWVRGVAFSADGRRVLTCGNDSTAAVWDADTGEPIVRLIGHDYVVGSVAFSPTDANIAVSGSGDNSLRVWDIATGNTTAVLQGHTSNVAGVAFTPDARHVLSCSADGSACVWDIKTSQVVYTFRNHARSVTDIACSPDGRYAFTCGQDNRIRLWRMPLEGQGADFLSGE